MRARISSRSPTGCFRSPVSYWDPAHHGGVLGAIEIALSIALALWLWRRLAGRGARAALTVLVAAELSPALLWGVLLV